VIGGIGSQSAAVATPPGNRPNAAGSLDAELAKYQSELADCVSCPSGKTSAGMANITQIASKLDAVKVRIRAAEQAKTSEQVTSSKIDASREQQSRAAQNAVGSSPAPDSISAGGRGSIVDLYA
jgi:hypothetical protein